MLPTECVKGGLEYWWFCCCGFCVHCIIHATRKDSTQETHINLLNSTGHVIHQQFNIQQLYALPTLYLCVLYLSENKQRLVPLTA